MGWTSGGNVTKASDIDKLGISGDEDEAQVTAARKAAKALLGDLGKAEEYIVNLAGQTEPDRGAGQPHMPHAAISINVATTVPLP